MRINPRRQHCLRCDEPMLLPGKLCRDCKAELEFLQMWRRDEKRRKDRAEHSAIYDKRRG